jgi:hypothetical protein
VYPDKWDSLTDGTNLWTPGNVNTKTKGLHQELSASSGTGGDGDPIIATGKLTISNLNATEVAAFNKVGITTLMNLTSTSSSRPGDMFTTPVTISASTPVAIVNASGGKKIVDHIYRQNLQAGATSGTIPANTKLVVFGVGPQNSLIPNSMLEAPTYGNANATYIYNRLLAVFEVATSSSGSVKVTFKGILGTDGDLLDDMSVNMQNATL